MIERINTYIAVLLITIAGSGATLLIVHIAYSDTLSATISGSEANYQLQEALLKEMKTVNATKTRRDTLRAQ